MVPVDVHPDQFCWKFNLGFHACMGICSTAESINEHIILKLLYWLWKSSLLEFLLTLHAPSQHYYVRFFGCSCGLSLRYYPCKAFSRYNTMGLHQKHSHLFLNSMGQSRIWIQIHLSKTEKLKSLKLNVRIKWQLNLTMYYKISYQSYLKVPSHQRPWLPRQCGLASQQPSLAPVKLIQSATSLQGTLRAYLPGLVHDKKAPSKVWSHPKKQFGAGFPGIGTGQCTKGHASWEHPCAIWTATSGFAVHSLQLKRDCLATLLSISMTQICLHYWGITSRLPTWSQSKSVLHTHFKETVLIDF